MLFFPYKLDVVMEETPLANILLILIIISVFILAAFTSLIDSHVQTLILDGWGVTGFFGYMFLHADLLHLLGNMLFLWVFGNGVCSKVGNLRYTLIFISLGIFAAIIHNLFDGRTAVGASGVIYGIIGFYLALHPTNKITCFWWLLVRYGSIDISAYLLIGFWVLKDIFGLTGDTNTNIAHLAHLGGFVGGLSLGYWLVSKGSVIMYEYDLKTLPQMLSKT